MAEQTFEPLTQGLRWRHETESVLSISNSWTHGDPRCCHEELMVSPLSLLS